MKVRLIKKLLLALEKGRTEDRPPSATADDLAWQSF